VTSYLVFSSKSSFTQSSQCAVYSGSVTSRKSEWVKWSSYVSSIFPVHKVSASGRAAAVRRMRFSVAFR
jgi:hypothetical protein